MGRRLEPGKLVIASHNAGKVQEINDLVTPFGITAVAANELGLPSPEETETTFAGNAAIKAHAAAKSAKLPALADDSGLEITALDGKPGVYAADWAEEIPGGPRDFYRAMARVERELSAQANSDRSARFVCCLCLAWPDGEQESFLGKVDGTIVFPPRGTQGFGYDPIFEPLSQRKEALAFGKKETFGEMPPQDKHAISHRAHAFKQLIDACLS
ncbi:MAG: RdgB/HAM1 family non-canonical purine NTP pyrophosphatase [Pseudomonadota bacterium]